MLTQKFIAFHLALLVHSRHIFLPFGIFLCTAFGVGYQPIVILQWILPFLILRSLSTHKRKKKLYPELISCNSVGGNNQDVLEIQERNGYCRSWKAMFVCLSLGFWVSFGGSFTANDNWSASRLFMALGVAVILSVLTIIGFAIPHFYSSRFPDSLHVIILSLPVSWVSVWQIWGTLSLTGFYGHPSYSQYNLNPVVNLASLFGLSGILFLIGWFGSILHHGLVLVEVQFLKYQNEFQNSQTWQSMLLPALRPFLVHLRVFTVIFLAAFIYGGASSQVFTRSFYQKGIHDLTPNKYLFATCISGNSGWFPVPLNLTEERAKSGDDMILWSENTAQSYGNEQEAELHAKAAGISGKYNVVIGISYVQHTYHGKLKEQQQTKFVLFDRNGNKIFEYQKVNLIPFAEGSMQAGRGKHPPVAQIEGLGRVAAALCFDFDFPDFIRRASVKGVDIFLQPAWTWGSIAEFHAMDNAFRAVENGFQYFRCTSAGITALFNPVYEKEAWTVMNEDFDQATIKIPQIRQRWTLYCYFGFCFGWICVGLWSCLVLLIFIPQEYLKFGLKKINFPVCAQLWLFGKDILKEEEFESLPTE